MRFISMMLMVTLAVAQTPPPAAAPAPAKVKPPRVPKPGIPGLAKPIETVKPDFVFAVEGTPDWLVASDDAMWVSAIRSTKVARMNPKTGKVDALKAAGTVR